MIINNLKIFSKLLVLSKPNLINLQFKFKMSSKSVSTKSPAKAIKPLNPSEFDPESVSYSGLNINNEIGTKWINTTYEKSEDKLKQFIVTAKNCTVISYKKNEAKGKDGKPIPLPKSEKPRKDKYQLFVKIKDEAFIEFVKTYEEALIQVAMANSESWYGSEMDEKECTDMIRSLMSSHEKYGYSLSAILTPDCKCDSKVAEITDCSNREEVLTKNTIVNLVFNFSKVKIGVDTFRSGVDIKHISIVSVGQDTPYESNAITPEAFEEGKIILTAKETNDNNGKFCKAMYDDKLLRIKFNNVTGRIFRMEDPEGKVSFSLSIRLSDPANRKMIDTIDSEIFELLFKNSKEYFGSSKTKKQLKLNVKSLASYNKADKEKIDKGEKPTYDPSIWIKLYHSEEKGFDKKIINTENKKPLENVEDLLNKDLSINEIEAYSRHIWFGVKGTSVNFTLNRCEVSYDVPVYDMDDVEDDSNAKSKSKSKSKSTDEDDDDEEEETNAEAANSSNEE